jgi:ribonuclease HII
MLKTFMRGGQTEAGCDEVGRGCMAGPVVAAAVVMPPDVNHEWLKDSKQLNLSQRNEMVSFIKDHAISYAIGLADTDDIDRLNILRASFYAMHKALDQLNVQPDHLLVDGNRFDPYHQIPYTTVVKGDNEYTSIAAASILAKVHRDNLMKSLHKDYPEYGWDTNVGYPTPHHRKAIMDLGYSPYHRKSFKLKAMQQTLDL